MKARSAVLTSEKSRDAYVFKVDIRRLNNACQLQRSIISEIYLTGSSRIGVLLNIFDFYIRNLYSSLLQLPREYSKPKIGTCWIQIPYMAKGMLFKELEKINIMEKQCFQNASKKGDQFG